MAEHFGTLDEYEAALKQVISGAAAKQVDLLKAHCRLGTTTWSNLAREVGYGDFRGVNLHCRLGPTRTDEPSPTVRPKAGGSRRPEEAWILLGGRQEVEKDGITTLRGRM